MTQFRDNEEDSRFEWEEDGAVSFVDYAARDDVYSLLHVETPVAFRGRGAAGRLLDAVIANARERGFKLKPVCGYAVAYFKRHKNDVVDVAV